MGVMGTPRSHEGRDRQDRVGEEIRPRLSSPPTGSRFLREPVIPTVEDKRGFAMDTVRTFTALLVDDDAASRTVNQQRIEGDGYSVVVAADKTAALANAKQAAPNVIFIHMVGGRASSIPLIEALRKD